MKKLLSLVTITFISIGAYSLFAFEKVSTQELFYSYLKNDSDLKNLTIEAEKAQLALESTEIENGFDISLSTGTVTIKTAGDSSTLTVKSAGVSASLPQASNLTLSATSGATVTNWNFTDSCTLTDTKLNMAIDLISSSSLSRKIDLMTAERSLTQAKRNLQKEALQTETDFYTELKALLTTTSEIITAQTQLYTDTIDFESVKAKGYSTASSTYQLAQMKVTADQHDIESKTRSLIHDYIVFYKECGYEISLDSDTDFYNLIPSDLPQVQALNIEDFEADKYTEIEEALWTYEINSLSRSAEKSFSLSANGGYTFNNSTTSSNTVDAGLSSTIGGLNLSAGVSFPVTGGDPAYTFSASLSPSTFFQNSITKKTNDLTQEQELLAIEEARSAFETVKVDKEQELQDLQWNKESYQEAYTMYQELANQLETHYKAGLIKESEYLSALSNAKNYKVKLVSNSIDFIIYNNELQSLFVAD
ncbi:MAG: hypothetical protein K6C97_04785 [Treponema sp.]|nr:hypothetical protein [Treponema sp.]